MNQKINVSLFYGATAAYAAIRAQSRALDVKLEPGRSAAQSLRESADELRQQAARLVTRADLMDKAAESLDLKTPTE